MQRKVTVLGDGGWGTTMCLVAAQNGHEVTLWGHDPDHLKALAYARENQLFLKGVSLPETLRFEWDMKKAASTADLVVVAVPTKFLRSVFEGHTGLIPEGADVVSLTKGIERETLLRPSQLLETCLACDPVAVLSGPSHAEEVAKGLPASVTVASRELALAERVQSVLMTGALRIYTSDDVVGVELGGALKNVIAVAAGIATGLGLGDNAMAALVTRGLAEITRLGIALGADPLTFAGLSGMGDLITTCISPHGRNRAVGLAIGQGKTLKEVLSEMEMVAEGVTTVVSARDLGRQVGVDLPITEETWNILYNDKDPHTAVTDLMTREGKAEHD